MRIPDKLHKYEVLTLMLRHCDFLPMFLHDSRSHGLYWRCNCRLVQHGKEPPPVATKLGHYQLAGPVVMRAQIM